MTDIQDSAPSATWQVVCLCAQWCGACREWRPLFDSVAAAHPGLRFAWVDIEDQADAVAEVDIETFPTLLVAKGGQVRFYGAVQPSQVQLGRLLASLLADVRTGVAAIDARAPALLQRLEAGGLLV